VVSHRRRFGSILAGFSLALFVFAVGAFTFLPDRLAAFTVIPVWIWGGLGIAAAWVSFQLWRDRIALLVVGSWIIALFCLADETRALTNIRSEPPRPGPAMPYHGQPVIRVATLNCSSFMLGNPAPDLAAWQPDIVLLQEVFPYQIQQIASALGLENDARIHQTNGVITRWKIEREINDPIRRKQQVTIVMPSGARIEVVNVHLAMAVTDLRLWRASSWISHRSNRATHQNELAQDLQQLRMTTRFPDAPVLFGGDFNSTASDAIHRQLSNDLVDAFASIGTGLGNTFQRRLPSIRIDYLYRSRQLTPVRCRAVTTRHSDHRMVIADFLLESNASTQSISSVPSLSKPSMP